MADHEVYPNAPLRLVTAEYRFPHSPALAEPHVDARLAERLGSGLPIIEPLEQPRDQSTAEMAVSLFNKYQRQFIHKLSDEGWLLEQANDKTDNKKRSTQVASFDTAIKLADKWKQYLIL